MDDVIQQLLHKGVLIQYYQTPNNGSKQNVQIYVCVQQQVPK